MGLRLWSQAQDVHENLSGVDVRRMWACHSDTFPEFRWIVQKPHPCEYSRAAWERSHVRDGCSSASHHCNKMLATTNKEEGFILAHSFGGVSPWSVDTAAFEPVVRQHVVVRTHSRTSSLHRGGWKVKGSQKPGCHNPLQGHLSNDLHFPLGPTFFRSTSS
jgi:hypothetical protein